MSFPWARTEETEKTADMPIEYPEGPFKKYRVVAKQTTLFTDRCRTLSHTAIGPDGIPRGTIVDGDAEVWSNTEPGLFVHVIYPNPVLSGALLGWCPFEDLEPLSDEGEPLPRLTVIDVEGAMKIQRDYEHGYRSLGMQIAIRNALEKRAPTVSRREACDPVWMHVRGVMLARRGFPQTPQGFEDFETSIPREYSEDKTHASPISKDVSDADFVVLSDTHNRVVRLMNAMDPAIIPDALATRYREPFTRAQLEEMAMDCLATDVPIDEATMAHWSKARIEAYFESGGDDPGEPEDGLG